MQQLRESKKLVMWVVIGLMVFLVALMSFGPLFYRANLRYERNSYSVMKDHSVTSCAVKNYGRRAAEKTRMFVRFLSRILDIQLAPESAGRVVEIAADQRNAVIELKKINPGDEVTVFFSVEKPQDKPFDVYLLDVSDGDRPLKERITP